MGDNNGRTSGSNRGGERVAEGGRFKTEGTVVTDGMVAVAGGGSNTGGWLWGDV